MSKSFRWSSIRSDDGFKARFRPSSTRCCAPISHTAKKDPLECVRRGAAVNSRPPSRASPHRPAVTLSPPRASRPIACALPAARLTTCAVRIVVIIIEILRAASLKFTRWTDVSPRLQRRRRRMLTLLGRRRLRPRLSRLSREMRRG